MLNALDVLLIFDATIRPAGPKMVACIHPANGWFYRINSKGHWRPRVPLALAAHPFLDHDSFLECGDPLELDDYIVDEALSMHGVIGTISADLCAQIIETLDVCVTLLPADKQKIIDLLS